MLQLIPRDLIKASLVEDCQVMLIQEEAAGMVGVPLVEVEHLHSVRVDVRRWQANIQCPEEDGLLYQLAGAQHCCWKKGTFIYVFEKDQTLSVAHCGKPTAKAQVKFTLNTRIRCPMECRELD